MHYYPLFINLMRRSCLVVGAGGVGFRKAEVLARAGANVLILDVEKPSARITALCSQKNIDFEQRPFKKTDLEKRFLAIACTNNTGTNEEIARLCESQGVLCNIADQPEKGDFIVPATVTRGDLSIAISTAGKSPAMARRVRQEIETLIGDEYEITLALLAKVRPLVLDLGLETRQNTDIFRSLVFSEVGKILKVRDLPAATTALKEMLPITLHDRIPELLHGII